MERRTAQLQIRVTPSQKAALKAQARRAGMPLSAWVLSRTLPSARFEFERLLGALADSRDSAGVLAALNDLLTSLTGPELDSAVGDADPGALPALWQNYVAAMVELAAARAGVEPPAWTSAVVPLQTPWFATPLRGLRAHLLRESPVPFRRRNLFVDASLGDRV